MSQGGFRLLGHPVHAMLSAFPLALLLLSSLWDALALIAGDPVFWAVSFYSLAAGLAFAVLAAGAGLADYAAIPEDERAALTTAHRHLFVMLCAVSAYGASAAFRAGPRPPAGASLIGALACEGAGALALAAGGWLGGELVFGHGVGVRVRPGADRPKDRA